MEAGGAVLGIFLCRMAGTGPFPLKISSPLSSGSSCRFSQGDPLFFLNRGSALSAFYLQHRYSQDLDLCILEVMHSIECLYMWPTPRQS